MLVDICKINNTFSWSYFDREKIYIFAKNIPNKYCIKDNTSARKSFHVLPFKSLLHLKLNYVHGDDTADLQIFGIEEHADFVITFWQH